LNNLLALLEVIEAYINMQTGHITVSAFCAKKPGPIFFSSFGQKFYSNLNNSKHEMSILVVLIKQNMLY